MLGHALATQSAAERALGMSNEELDLEILRLKLQIERGNFRNHTAATMAEARLAVFRKERKNRT
jgi:hypothetical protein